MEDNIGQAHKGPEWRIYKLITHSYVTHASSFKEPQNDNYDNCGSVVEHCVSSAKGCGFNSQENRILITMYQLVALDKSVW